MLLELIVVLTDVGVSGGYAAKIDTLLDFSLKPTEFLDLT